ncbi:MAG: hypothetical protein F6K54_26305 [Okeania sp. SIO3B5]|uniref:hypothetical protein n=1 Tax=Okeania sp. SIO3B5 TaxID=2607811 RepID=UPI0014017ECD|nr:hypothetical protein [Okeania sp. SIO3B5]NEO56287.1 hypothetical protein [Okeania sp. SIO3B5]
MDSLKVTNKFEYWFLDNAVTMAIGFNDIVPDYNGDLGINRAPLELSLTEMANIMEGLFQRGDLYHVRLNTYTLEVRRQEATHP